MNDNFDDKVIVHNGACSPKIVTDYEIENLYQLQSMNKQEIRLMSCRCLAQRASTETRL